MQTKKILYILRHAKAETGSASQDDHDRAINKQGIDACAVMGKFLSSHAIVPQLVVCSTAKRARTTWSLIRQAYNHSFPEEFNDRLYLASASEIINQLALLPEKISSVMIVGHNPGLHQLCITLSRQGEDTLLDKLALKFPTCAFAAIDLGDVAWKDTARADGRLQMFVSPRMITG